ncbi:hypothetical protein LI328DRAFT_34667 [Trichoderma asperelloides]|nr:hypothetical protein LI328DRAFT_34667 [Trichoderma asperelloides]
MASMLLSACSSVRLDLCALEEVTKRVFHVYNQMHTEYSIEIRVSSGWRIMPGPGSWLAPSQNRCTHASSVPLPRCRRIAAREEVLPSPTNVRWSTGAQRPCWPVPDECGCRYR